jgi:succinate-semialdehyde dehydrogenase/glutarate-semialdehyde dehydrogenase
MPEGLTNAKASDPPFGRANIALETSHPNGAEETRRAIEAADRALPPWRAKTAKEPAQILAKKYDLMMANHKDLATLMTAVRAKSLTESRGGIACAAAFIEWFGEEGKRVYADTIPAHAAGERIVVTEESVGVCAAITPWNFPAPMITRKAGPGIAVGLSSVERAPEASLWRAPHSGRYAD